jgi:hypothetical protein
MALKVINGDLDLDDQLDDDSEHNHDDNHKDHIQLTEVKDVTGEENSNKKMNESKEEIKPIIVDADREILEEKAELKSDIKEEIINEK